MPIIDFTQEDLAGGVVVKPSWYRIRVNEVGEKPSKDKLSTNYPVEATVLFDGDNGDTEFAGAKVTIYLNSKGKGFIAAFLNALGEQVVPGRVNLEAAKGMQLDTYIGNKLYEGRQVNDFSGKYRRIKPEVVAKPAA